jgi:hypothetical protein
VLLAVRSAHSSATFHATNLRGNDNLASHSYSGRPAFVDVAAQAGLRYRWVVEGKRPYNILQTIGNGCAFLDYNNDGNLDVLLVGSPLALYQGNGKGQFRDVSKVAGIANLRGHFLAARLAITTMMETPTSIFLVMAQAFYCATSRARPFAM